ncbi:MAG: hypothetical protein E6J83_07640 [Deltaproteobacteria bacterium]|nr:MAG: hypothetical protein E6J83_07640 [Deltaproteobacteria bacterium]
MSRAEQRRRLLERLRGPTKMWKFSEQDIVERRHWTAYIRAYEKLVTRLPAPERGARGVPG